MKKGVEDDEMREEYDFSNAVRNAYFQRFQELNLVSLDPDVKQVFPDSDAVNAELRMVMRAGARAAGMRVREKRAS